MNKNCRAKVKKLTNLSEDRTTYIFIHYVRLHRMEVKKESNKFVLLTLYNDQDCWPRINSSLQLNDEAFFVGSNGQSKY